MRLIDADAYRAILATMWEKSCDNIVRSVLCECMMQLHSVPTIDAVEVVRCKDCKHWAVLEECGHYCSHWGNLMTDTLEDDFCSNGERKEP